MQQPAPPRPAAPAVRQAPPPLTLSGFAMPPVDAPSVVPAPAPAPRPMPAPTPTRVGTSPIRGMFGGGADARASDRCRRGLGSTDSIAGAYDLESTSQRTVDLSDLRDRVRLFGQFDQNLSALEERLRVSVRADGDRLFLAGSAANVERAEHAVRRMLDAAVGGAQITPDDVVLAITENVPGTLLRTQRGKEIRAKTAGQRALVESIAEQYANLWYRPGGNRKDVPRRGDGGARSKEPRDIARDSFATCG